MVSLFLSPVDILSYLCKITLPVSKLRDDIDEFWPYVAINIKL